MSWFAMVLDIGDDAVRREQRCKDMAVLASLACGERSKRSNGVNSALFSEASSLAACGTASGLVEQ